ncbi:MAG: DNA-processing protein DprA [Candidatus Pacebacteria bacterium]|nr:DNA-processing protein DprA [Candidatus Paceibacterota bacterium]
MDFRIEKISPESFPPALLEIPDSPELLYCVGSPLPIDGLYLSVVGSRNHTSYGADACDKLIRGLKGSDIIIVSGLALGIDSIAHRSAIKAGLKTIAFPGSGLSESALYPATNLSLAKEILASGGTLVSEFEPAFKATQWSFPRRNRLMAGISHAVLVIEAANKSGTLITARLALDYNREVLAVPGPITSENSLGANLLIKQGATPITRSEDILEVFGIKQESLFEEVQNEVANLSPDEREIYEILFEPMPRDEIFETLGKPMNEINSLLSIMEIKGLIKEELGEIRRI